MCSPERRLVAPSVRLHVAGGVAASVAGCSGSPWPPAKAAPGVPPSGLAGLATMGANVARNVAHHDIPVAVHNRTTSRTERFIAQHGSEGPLTSHRSVQDWVG